MATSEGKSTALPIDSERSTDSPILTTESAPTTADNFSTLIQPAKIVIPEDDIPTELIQHLTELKNIFNTEYSREWEFYNVIAQFLNFAWQIVTSIHNQESQRVSMFLANISDVLKNRSSRIEDFISNEFFVLYFSQFANEINNLVEHLNIRFIKTAEGIEIIARSGLKRKNSLEEAIPTKNSFQALSDLPNNDDDGEMQVVDEGDEASTSKTKTIQKPNNQNDSKAKNRKFAPYQLFFETDRNLNAHLQNIHKLAPKADTTYIRKQIKIEMQELNDFHTIQTYLKENKVPARSLDTKSAKPKKLVLRGLPADTPVQDIEAELRSIGIEPLQISTLINRKTKERMPIFLLTLRPSPNIENITNIHKINFLKVTFQEYKFKNISQCYRCQQYGHSSLTCQLTPKCLKCAKTHEGKCNTPADQFKCANCGGQHAANFNGCPFHPSNRRVRNSNTPSKDFNPAPLPKVNAWNKKPNINSTSTTPQPSNETNNTAPTAQKVTPPTYSAPPKTPVNQNSQNQPKTNKTIRTQPNDEKTRENTKKNKEKNGKNKEKTENNNSGIGEIFKFITEMMKNYNIHDIIKLLQNIANVMKEEGDSITKLYSVFTLISDYFNSSETNDE